MLTYRRTTRHYAEARLLCGVTDAEEVSRRAVHHVQRAGHWDDWLGVLTQGDLSTVFATVSSCVLTHLPGCCLHYFGLQAAL